MNNKEEIKHLNLLSQNLKRLRKEKKLTQADCGVDDRTVRRIENENFNPSYLTLVQIAQKLEIKLSDLLNFE